MILDKQQHLGLHIQRARSIARRYLVTNGFDGALIILSMVRFFHKRNDRTVSGNHCLLRGCAVALFISGLSSAYMSEKAEQEKELHELEQALVNDLKESDYGQASRYLPIMVALVNGCSPFLLALIILLPLFYAEYVSPLPLSPFFFSIVVGLICVFLLGLFLGKISKTFWLWSGLRTLGSNHL
jgi:predicted membrane protein (TIGR00267 family)